MDLNEQHQALRQTVARFVTREIHAHPDEGERPSAPLHGRSAALPVTYGMVLDMIDHRVECLRQRSTFGKPLIQRQGLCHRMADSLTAVEVFQQLPHHLGRMTMTRADAPREISLGKPLAAEVAMRAWQTAVSKCSGAWTT